MCRLRERTQSKSVSTTTVQKGCQRNDQERGRQKERQFWAR